MAPDLFTLGLYVGMVVGFAMGLILFTIFNAYMLFKDMPQPATRTFTSGDEITVKTQRLIRTEKKLGMLGPTQELVRVEHKWVKR
jgi:hypothetical protein